MFSTDPKLEVRSRRSTSFRSQLNQLTNTFLIDRDEWIPRDNALRKILRQKHSRIVTAHAERRLREIIGSE